MKLLSVLLLCLSFQTSYAANDWSNSFFSGGKGYSQSAAIQTALRGAQPEVASNQSKCEKAQGKFDHSYRVNRCQIIAANVPYYWCNLTIFVNCRFL